MIYLVIVESPNKKVKISKYLNTIPGHQFIVEASCGHIRYFANGLKSIDTSNKYKPTYSVVTNKRKVVANIKELVKKVDEVIIATDQDREGEAIGFHLVETLHLNPNVIKRICFNEITQKAVVEAFHNHRLLDRNLYNAQQSRSIIDILIGFEISPILWKYIAPSLSAGRCQSPALKLIYEKETEIENFQSEKYYTITGEFMINKTQPVLRTPIIADYWKTIENKETIQSLLTTLIQIPFQLLLVKTNEVKITPPPPFITSTIQQEASSRFSLPPSSTMKVLQNLYEKGKITYLRTDSTSISELFIQEVKEYIDSNYNGLFEKRQYEKKVVNAQEAHECIRCVSMTTELDSSFSPIEHKVFTLIKNRTIASQMKKYVEEQYHYEFVDNGSDHKFKFTLKKIIQLGWKTIYHTSDNGNNNNNTSEDGNSENNVDTNDDTDLIQYISKHIFGKKRADNAFNYQAECINAKETLTNPKSRYTEATLIRELEKRGIGRPSTFSGIVSTMLERSYVTKKTKLEKKSIQLEKYSIKKGELNVNRVEFSTTQKSDKNCLFISPMGKTVCSFLNLHFPMIQSYDLTSEIESDLDDISNGSKIWYDVIDKIYKSFHPIVSELSVSNISKQIHKDNTYENRNNASPETTQLQSVDSNIVSVDTQINDGPKQQNGKKKDRPSSINVGSSYKILCKNPENDKNVYIFNGPYGLCIMEGEKNSEYRYVSVNLPGKSLDDITSDIALDLLKYPITLGTYNDHPIYLKKGFYGFYIEYNSQKISTEEPNISLDDAIGLIEKKLSNVVKEFKGLKILNGPYGPYIQKGKQNYKIPKEIIASSLTKKKCDEIIANANKMKSTGQRYKNNKKDNTNDKV
jgi:DNA topoisomerase-1